MLSLYEKTERMNKTMLPSKAKQNALVNGYVRQQTKFIKYTIFPTTLNNLCFTFYNQISYITFKDELLSEFIQTSDGECWEDKPVKIKGIEFVSTFYPDHDTNQLGYDLKIVSAPNNKYFVTARVSIYCPEIDAFILYQIR